MYHGEDVGFETYLPTGDIYPRPIGKGVSICQDIVGNFPNPNGLVIEHFSLSPGTMSGQEPFFPVYKYDNVPYLGQPGYTVHATTLPKEPWMPPSPNSDATDIANVLASTIPTRPEVSVPNLVWELIPKRLNLAGKKHASRKPRNSVAEHNFGWAQLYRDVSRLIDFNSQVEKRDRELKSLYSKGGLSRKRVVWEGDSPPVVSSHTVNSVVCWVEVTRTAVTSRRRWITVRWLPDYSRPIPTDPERLQQARLLVHGWSNAPARVWEALPWSWFIDYFASIGKYLEVHANSLGVTATNICVCETTRTRTNDVVTSVTGGFGVSPGHSEYVLKTRTLGSFGLTTQMPILSAQQMTTLAGIAANYQ